MPRRDAVVESHQIAHRSPARRGAMRGHSQGTPQPRVEAAQAIRAGV